MIPHCCVWNLTNARFQYGKWHGHLDVPNCVLARGRPHHITMREAFSGLGLNQKPIGWPHAVAVGLTILFIAYIAYATARNYFDPEGVDFVSFWAAGRLALDGAPADAYDIARHHAVEVTSGGPVGLLPFPYPPPFLFFVTPFALAPFWVAFGLWVIGSAALFLIALKPLVRPPWALLHPAAHVNVLIGQNGLLTAGILVAGVGLLRSTPFLGGAILGLLVIKPQLAVLLPFALLAGREWRAIGGAAMSVVTLLAAALLVFGLAAYQGFFAILPEYAGFMRQNAWPWGELASVFAFARALGIAPTLAMTAQIVIAAGALVVTCLVWARRGENRLAVLASATLLMPPYLLNYDSLLLIVPIAYLMQERSTRFAALLVWLSCLPAIFTYLEMYRGPNTVTLGAIVALCICARDRRTPSAARDATVSRGAQPAAAV